MIKVDYARDSLFDEQGYVMLTAKGLYKKEHEKSPQETLARAANCYSFGDKAFAQRIYDYASKKWFGYASPVISNAVEIDWPEFTKEQWEEACQWLVKNVEPDGMPISCFKSEIPDTKFGLVEASTEQRWMSMMGGGVGIIPGMRSPDDKSTGVMAHIAVSDKDTRAYKQTQKRRGSMSTNLRIDHPEIMNFITMRDPTGGDPNNKCFNINSCVCITDDFMVKMINGEDYELVDPKHGLTGRYLKARTVWEELMQQRFKTGEPYLFFIDTANERKPDWITNPEYEIHGTNLCVAPETQILTDNGYFPIAELVNQTVNVWNGEEWSDVEVVQTGTNQKLLQVVTDFGHTLNCTPYHKFYVQTGYSRGAVVEKRAFELKPGDKLIKFDLPVIEGEKDLSKAYTNGFFTGDGTVSKAGSFIDLYHDKRKLKDKIDTGFKWCVSEDVKRERVKVTGLKHKFFVPDASYTIKSRLEWLAGWLDADGTIAKNGTNHSIQATSIEMNFLTEVQLMLQTLGVQSKIQVLSEEGYKSLPKNNGTGEYGDYFGQTSYRLLISSNGLYKLSTLGFETYRLEWDKRLPQREAERFVTIKEVVDNGRCDNTYCFSEPKRHMGMFNGILTGQCSEITLFTNEVRSAVCCLSSVNLELYDEWKDTNMVKDLIRFLDNVLEYFIRLAPPELKRAIYSAQQERSLGLGSMGWHSYLQKKRIPFESGGFNSAIQHTNIIFGDIKRKAVEASKELAKERGEAPDCKGSGMRNANLLAIAPNGNSADILGTSPSREPRKNNAFIADGRAGAFLKKNKYLEQDLEWYGLNTEEVWESIRNNDGSVQHLDIPDEVKALYKTAREIDPMWIIEHAAEAQKHVCQSISTNLFVWKDITLDQMSDVHTMAWFKKLKSLYYCRAQGADTIRLGTGGDEPLNSMVVKREINFETCLSCEG